MNDNNKNNRQFETVLDTFSKQAHLPPLTFICIGSNGGGVDGGDLIVDSHDGVGVLRVVVVDLNRRLQARLRIVRAKVTKRDV